MFDQQGHILSGNEQASRYGQKRVQCSINQFTYELDMRNETGRSEGRLVRNQQVYVHPCCSRGRRQLEKYGF